MSRLLWFEHILIYQNLLRLTEHCHVKVFGSVLWRPPLDLR